MISPSTRLSEAFRESHTDVPWRAIVGMRNQLIHGYHYVDSAVGWTHSRDRRNT